MKKVISSLLATLMALSPMSVLANGGGTAPVQLTITPMQFSATVPTGLVLNLQPDGTVLTPTVAEIKNNSIGPIKVVSVQTTAQSPWKLTNYTDDYTSKAAGSKELALQFNNDNVSANGECALSPQNWPTIAGNGVLGLDYSGKVAPQITAIESVAAHVVFTLDWDTSTSTPEVPESKYVLATDADFSGTTEGSFRYIGTDKYVEIPHIIKGISVTSYNRMFENSSVEGVKSTNKNVTDMRHMFASSRATKLDLSQLDTSNVTNMEYMFYYSKATSLDLSSFNTSNVTNMEYMFYNSQTTEIKGLSSFDTSNVTYMQSMFENSQATVLDLSGFDTLSVTSMDYMFSNAQTTIGYARTQADADKFNNSNNKPDALTFVVK